MYYYFPFYEYVETAPCTFYKFVKDDDGHKALKSICDGYLKFSRITDMNDSSEECAFANYEDYCKTVKRIFNDGCSQEDIKMLSKHYDLIDKIFPELEMYKRKDFFIQKIPSWFRYNQQNIVLNAFAQVVQGYDFFSKLEQFFKLVHKNILNRVGVLCISPLLNNYPMWAHYADYARGFAVEFQNLHLRFNGDGTSVLHQLDKVRYLDVKEPTSTTPSDLAEIFRTKLTDWEYEKEYRIVELLSECEAGDNSQFFYPVGREYISRIIVGWKCSDVRFKEIKEIADEAGIEVLRLRMDEHGKIVSV